jgi:Tn3 transposase DDE domain
VNCLSLPSNAAVLWNTVQMAGITQQLRDAGNEIAGEELADVWPRQRTRTIPNGTYFLNWPQVEAAAAAVS